MFIFELVLIGRLICKFICAITKHKSRWTFNPLFGKHNCRRHFVQDLPIFLSGDCTRPASRPWRLSHPRLNLAHRYNWILSGNCIQIKWLLLPSAGDYEALKKMCLPISIYTLSIDIATWPLPTAVCIHNGKPHCTYINIHNNCEGKCDKKAFLWKVRDIVLFDY